MALPLSDMSRDALVRELRFAASKRLTDRVTAVKRELAKRGSAKTNAIAPQASTAQTRRWWNDD